MFATQTVTGSAYAPVHFCVVKLLLDTLVLLYSQRGTSLRQKQHNIVFDLLSQFGEPNEALTYVGAFLYLFLLYFRLEYFSDTSLTGHCLLRKLTVNELLGV